MLKHYENGHLKYTHQHCSAQCVHWRVFGTLSPFHLAKIFWPGQVAVGPSSSRRQTPTESCQWPYSVQRSSPLKWWQRVHAVSVQTAHRLMTIFRNHSGPPDKSSVSLMEVGQTASIGRTLPGMSCEGLCQGSCSPRILQNIHHPLAISRSMAWRSAETTSPSPCLRKDILVGTDD